GCDGRPRRPSESTGGGEIAGAVSERLQRLEMVARLLLPLPRNERRRHDARAKPDGSQRKNATPGIPHDRENRELRRSDAGVGQAARRQTDRAALYLRQGEGRQSATARTARRGRTERRPVGSSRELVATAVASHPAARPRR